VECKSKQIRKSNFNQPNIKGSKWKQYQIKKNNLSKPGLVACAISRVRPNFHNVKKRYLATIVFIKKNKKSISSVKLIIW
jgi:hypothetical protein